MRATFEAAGFDDNDCEFVLMDNVSSNEHEPFSAFSAQLDAAERKGQSRVVLCHQDVRLDRGHGRQQLDAELDRLDDEHPEWAVCGNAGYASDRRGFARRITDPTGTWHLGRLPERVVSMDENFFVVRPEAGVRFSATLSGFHFYATDLCLQAQRRGRTCFVIDFHLTHLSDGRAGGGTAAFYEAKRAFQHQWNCGYRLALLLTPFTIIPVSRYALGRLALRSNLLRRVMRRTDVVRLPRAPLEGPTMHLTGTSA